MISNGIARAEPCSTYRNSYTVKLLEFQMPIFNQAIKDKKPFDEAFALARSEPWPAGLSEANLISFDLHPCLPEDKEGEKVKRAQRAADVRVEKAKRARRKAPYNPDRDVLFVTVCLVDDDGNVLAKAAEWQGTEYDIADRLFRRTDVMTLAGERFEMPDLRLVIDEITRVTTDGRRFAFQDTRNTASPEVWQAIKLPIHQRKLFGAAKALGLSDADALATALGDERKAEARDEYQARLASAWRSSTPKGTDR